MQSVAFLFFLNGPPYLFLIIRYHSFIKKNNISSFSNVTFSQAKCCISIFKKRPTLIVFYPAAGWPYKDMNTFFYLLIWLQFNRHQQCSAGSWWHGDRSVKSLLFFWNKDFYLQVHNWPQKTWNICWCF